MEQTFFTVAEICEMTGLGRTKIYEEINNGRLDAKKCGRRTLVTANSFNKWISELKPYIGMGSNNE